MWTAIAVIALILLYFIAVYNGLVARQNQVKEAWATIDTQLKRRYDLIPNLVSTVQEYMKYEKDTLNQLTELRTQALKGNISHDELIGLSQKAEEAPKKTTPRA